MPDPTRLYVKATGATHPLDQKYDIYHTVNNVPTRVNLCGFSYFGEIGGVNLNNATEGIDLRGPGDPPQSVAPPKYSLTFAEYLDKLRAARVNWVRVFLFDELKYRYYPFVGSFEQNFDLDKINPTYITRLKNFVETARARGIVVCISFFSSQSLKVGPFANFNPFHYNNNNNEVVTDSAGNAVDKGLNHFCLIKKPDGPLGIYKPDWAPEERLWWLQRNLITQIVNATKEYWNVAYEPFNEPNKAIPGVIDWHATVTGWLKQLLWDATANRRSRLVVINAGDDLLDTTNFMSRLLPAGQPPLFDVFDFHGGGAGLASQWGGPHGNNRNEVCPAPPPPPDQIIGQIVRGKDEGTLHHKGIIDAMNRFKSRPVALIFDTDAQYWAQRLVTPYLEEVLNVDGSFAYRWANDFLNAVSEANCKIDLTPLRSGLDQRLAKISAARNRSRITVFQ